MTVTATLILTGIVGVFAAFIVTLGGVNAWITLSERRVRRRTARFAPKPVSRRQPA